ncbi:MAG: hypothetical protein KZQ96_19845 [Candidatus Thiodiazotropha sp. (ex Lucinoma borealis)]|nr:hypothetical protein [Candidatus Thiodiazotropha sp. (ex Lucinoma borealis)]
MSKEPHQQMFVEFLSEEGYRPQIGDSGLISFNSDGMNYFVLIDENDDQFFRLVVPNFWSIDNEDVRRMVQAAGDDSSASTKVAKIFTVDDNVWAAYESFFSTPEHFKGIFPRALSVLNTSVQNFAARMRE